MSRETRGDPSTRLPPNGRLAESAALLFLRGEGRHLLRGKAAATQIFVRAATRLSDAEAQVAALRTLARVLPHAPFRGAGSIALLFVFV